jgi:DNA-binding response OmpR family regulator
MDNNKRILLVDDEPDLTQVSTLALEYHGFKVEIHFSGVVPDNPNTGTRVLQPKYHIP